MPIKKRVLTIDRKKWARGGKEPAYLLSGKGKMCCLGFDARACGLSKERILMQMEPCEIEVSPDEKHYITKRLISVINGYGNNSKLIDDLMSLNDNPDIGDSEREERLTPLLKKLGYAEVHFVN